MIFIGIAKDRDILSAMFSQSVCVGVSFLSLALKSMDLDEAEDPSVRCKR